MIRTASMLISTLNRNEADVYIVKWVDTINIFTRIELHVLTYCDNGLQGR